jgi:hypothetical protein
MTANLISPSLKIPKVDLGSLFEDSDGWFAGIIGSSSCTQFDQLSTDRQEVVELETDKYEQRLLTPTIEENPSKAESPEIISNSTLIPNTTSEREEPDTRSEEGSMYESDGDSVGEVQADDNIISNNEEKAEEEQEENKLLKGALKPQSSGPYAYTSKPKAQKRVKFEVSN